MHQTIFCYLYVNSAKMFGGYSNPSYLCTIIFKTTIMRSLQLITDQLLADLANLQSRLETVNSTITNTPYIVCSSDCFYTVGLKEDGVTCTVRMGDSSPTMFGRANAIHIVNGFKASNGSGQIKWMMMSEAEFLEILIADFEATIHIVKSK